MPNSTIAAQRLAATAKALAACCRENRTDEGLDALYADDVVSVEPVAPTGGGPRRRKERRKRKETLLLLPPMSSSSPTRLLLD